MSAPNMGLISEQISHFNTFGVIVIKQVFGNAGATNWHCDTAPKHQFGVKCAF